MRPVPIALRKYLHRINPKVEMAVELLAIENEDRISTKTDWDAATQSPTNNFESYADGTIRLTASDLSVISRTTSNGWIAGEVGLTANAPTDTCSDESGMPGCVYPAIYAVWEMDASFGSATTLRKFKAYLTRNRAGAGDDFNGVFKCEVFTLQWYGIEERRFIFQGIQFFDTLTRNVGAFVSLGDPVYVNAITSTEGTLRAPGWPEWTPGTGTDTGLVEFDFVDSLIRVGRISPPRFIGSPDHRISGQDYPRRVVMVRISQVGGTTGTTNAGWAIDDTVSQVSNSNGLLYMVAESSIVKEGAVSARAKETNWIRKKPDGTKSDDRYDGVPRCEFIIAQYPTGTSTIKKQLDLGAAPGGASDVEFGAIFDEPEGTTCTPEVSTNDTSYVSFTDGDTAADLSLAAQQTYWLRYSMASNTNRDTSPIGFELSVKERSRTDITDIVKVSGGEFAVDPRIMRSEIRAIDIEMIRDGIRDFGDTASVTASSYHPNQLEVELSIRAAISPVPSRDDWMLIDKFTVAETESLWGSERLECYSVLEKLKADIPRLEETSPGSGNYHREPIAYSAQTISAVWSDILDKALVPGRMKGQAPSNALIDPDDGSSFNASLSKTLVKSREAKKEVDHLSLIAGGVTTTRAGQIMFRSMLDQKEVSVVFHEADIILGSTPRNFAERMIFYTVPYLWSDDDDDFTGEVTAFDGDASANLGVPTVGRRDATIDDEAAKYLPDLQHARSVAHPQIKSFGAGVLYPWEMISVIPHPELEVGDVVAIITDRITVRDPITNNAIKGKAYIRAVIAGSDLWGRRFTLWIRSFADILRFGSNAGTIGQIAGVPEVLSSTVTEEAGTSNRKVSRSVAVDVETYEAWAFRRRSTTICSTDAGWPTLDGKQASQINWQWFKKTLSDDNGWQFATEGHQGTDYIRDIIIPVDKSGYAGPRGEYCYDVVGSGTPDPAFVLTGRQQTSDGTDCITDLREITITWTVNSGVSDANHEIYLEYDPAGGDNWQSLSGPLTPSTGSQVEEFAEIENELGWYSTINFRLLLKDKASPYTLRDTRVLNQKIVYQAIACPE